MTPRKEAEPSAEEPPPWDLEDLKSIIESLESSEATLQGYTAVDSIDVVLRYQEKIVVAHHDGTKWRVKFE